jgi:hypothetical protein
MNDAMNNWSVQVVGMLAISAAVIAVFWAAEGLEEALYAGAVLLAFTALVHFGRRRSNTLEVMSGTGDERVRSLYICTRSRLPAPSWRSCCQGGSS